MGLRSLGNPVASFLDVFSETVSGKSTTTTAATELNVFGGNVAGRIVGDWTYHTFTSPGTLTLQNTSVAKDAEFLLVAGGGAGGVANNNGSDGGGGAGAGNVNTYTGFTTADLGDGDFSITVGTGAARFPGPPSPGSTTQSSQVGGDTTVVKDGPNAELRAKGGGGGGAGGAAAPGTSAPKGQGGAAVQIPGFNGNDIGVPALIPYNGYYGGGGPGGSGGPGHHPATDAPANGATPGSPVSNGPRQGGDAAANTGGGGGAASGAPSPPAPGSPDGAGGPGIVVFRYRQ